MSESRWYPIVQERPIDGETPAYAKARRERNRQARAERDAFLYARCVCGLIRGNVVHEMDPEHSPEGPAYYEGWQQHPFQEAPHAD